MYFHNSLRYSLLNKQLSSSQRCGAIEKYIAREARTKKQEMELLEDDIEWVKDRGKNSTISETSGIGKHKKHLLLFHRRLI
jgi:hypothetical protein